MAKYEGQKEVGLVKYDPINNNSTIKQIEEDIEELQTKKGAHSNE